MRIVGQVIGTFVMGIADGPTEVHKMTVARQVLRDDHPSNDLFPACHLPRRREAALEKYAEMLEPIDDGF
jgi:acyl-CoA dehydrogenase